jgi:hydroxymethylpyrimidine/phosphomethylpyrimidine kinase
MIPKILTIAGSDPSGGAGVQADLKTIAMLGGYGMSAITSVTVQDTSQVYKTYDIPAPIVADQIRVVLEDIGADVIKTGMLSSTTIVRAVIDALATYSHITKVIDPVMLSTSGTRLLDPSAIKLLKTSLFPGSIITPNVPEAESLTALSITTVDHMLQAGKKLCDMGAKAVVIKGGHIKGDKVHDVLVSDEGTHVFDQDWIDTKHTHGTGCTFASALACFIGQGKKLEEAVDGARQYVHKAIRNAPGLGNGNGPLGIGLYVK